MNTILYQANDASPESDAPNRTGRFLIDRSVLLSYLSDRQAELAAARTGQVLPEGIRPAEAAAELIGCEWLIAICQNPAVEAIAPPPELDNQIEPIMERILFNKKSYTCMCISCRQHYSPDRLTVSEWKSTQGHLGGRMIICPDQHVLFTSTDWVKTAI